MKVYQVKALIENMPDEAEINICNKHHWRENLWTIGLILWAILLTLSIAAHLKTL